MGYKGYETNRDKIRLVRDKKITRINKSKSSGMRDTRNTKIEIISLVLLICIILLTLLFERIEFKIDEGNTSKNYEMLLTEETKRIEQEFEGIESILISKNQEIKKYENFGGALDTKVQEVLMQDYTEKFKLNENNITQINPITAVAYINLDTGNKIVKTLENNTIDIDLALKEYTKVMFDYDKEIMRSEILADNKEQYFFYYLLNPDSKLLVLKLNLEYIKMNDVFSYKYVTPSLLSFGEEIPAGEVFTNKDDLDNTYLAENRLLVATSTKYNLNFYTPRLNVNSSEIVIFKKTPEGFALILFLIAFFSFIFAIGRVFSGLRDNETAFIYRLFFIMGYVLVIIYL